MTSTSSLSYDLTVITVCLNVLTDVQHTVESVLKQKRHETLRIEHVIIDGASTDGTPQWLAEALNDGRIEQYISEKDSGIYDAMNKGISLARGRVLSFLNAGDWFAQQDLTPVVHPILEGKQAATFCTVQAHTVEGKVWNYRPSLMRKWWDILGCHQGYFVSADVCRAVRGYDSDSFRCAADWQLINTVMRQYGDPLIVDIAPVHFREGGFSSNFWKAYRHEIIELHARAWDKISEHCTADANYARMMLAMLAWHCLEVIQMTPEKRRSSATQIKKLIQMCKDIPTEHNVLHRTLMTCVGFVQRAMKHDNPVTKRQWFLFQFPHFICAISQSNPYKKLYIGPSKSQIISLARQRFTSALFGSKRK